MITFSLKFKGVILLSRKWEDLYQPGIPACKMDLPNCTGDIILMVSLAK